MLSQLTSLLGLGAAPSAAEKSKGENTPSDFAEILAQLGADTDRGRQDDDEIAKPHTSRQSGDGTTDPTSADDSLAPTSKETVTTQGDIDAVDPDSDGTLYPEVRDPEVTGAGDDLGASITSQVGAKPASPEALTQRFETGHRKPAVSEPVEKPAYKQGVALSYGKAEGGAVLPFGVSENDPTKVTQITVPVPSKADGARGRSLGLAGSAAIGDKPEMASLESQKPGNQAVQVSGPATRSDVGKPRREIPLLAAGAERRAETAKGPSTRIGQGIADATDKDWVRRAASGSGAVGKTVPETGPQLVTRSAGFNPSPAMQNHGSDHLLGPAKAPSTSADGEGVHSPNPLRNRAGIADRVLGCSRGANGVPDEAANLRPDVRRVTTHTNNLMAETKPGEQGTKPAVFAEPVASRAAPIIQETAKMTPFPSVAAAASEPVIKPASVLSTNLRGGEMSGSAAMDPRETGIAPKETVVARDQSIKPRDGAAALPDVNRAPGAAPEALRAAVSHVDSGKPVAQATLVPSVPADKAVVQTNAEDRHSRVAQSMADGLVPPRATSDLSADPGKPVRAAPGIGAEPDTGARPIAAPDVQGTRTPPEGNKAASTGIIVDPAAEPRQPVAEQSRWAQHMDERLARHHGDDARPANPPPGNTNVPVSTKGVAAPSPSEKLGNDSMALGRVTSPFLADFQDDPLQTELQSTGPVLDARSSTAAGSQPAAIHRAEVHPVLRQVAEAIARTGDGGVEIRLSPEELGHVRLQMAQSDTALTVHITADRPETLDLMRRHIDQLARDLADAGYGAAEFTFGDGGSGEQGRQQSGDGKPAAAPEQGTESLKPQKPASNGLDLRI